MTHPIKAFFKWIFDLGIKFVTKILRSSAEAEGVPKSRLPTERDVTWELGYTLIKRVAKAGLSRVKDKISVTLKSPYNIIVGLAEATQPKNYKPLIIDI